MSLLRKLFRVEEWAVWSVSWIPPLATRIVVGYGFYLTGDGKLGNIDGIVEFFRELEIPYPEYQAPFVANLEYWGGLLLMLGLLTRVLSAMLAGSMGVALMTADKEKLLESLDLQAFAPEGVTAFTYLLLLAWLIVAGAGALSLDRAIRWVVDRRLAHPEPSHKVVVVKLDEESTHA